MLVALLTLERDYSSGSSLTIDDCDHRSVNMLAIVTLKMFVRQTKMIEEKSGSRI